jgi:hypothetical protein
MCLVLTGLAGALGLASCSSSADCSGSSFTATVKSGTTTVLSLKEGTACWSLTGSSVSGDWALGITDANGFDRIVIGWSNGGTPSSNTPYPLPVVGGTTTFGTRVALALGAVTYVCGPATEGTINFGVVGAPDVSGSIAVSLLCADINGGTAYYELDVPAFTAKEGHVSVIP